MCTYVYTCLHMYTCACEDSSMYTRVNRCIHIHPYMYAYKCTNMYVYIYIFAEKFDLRVKCHKVACFINLTPGLESPSLGDSAPEHGGAWFRVKDSKHERTHVLLQKMPKVQT